MRTFLIYALAASLFVPNVALALENPVVIPLSGSAGRGTAMFYQSGDHVLVNVEFSNLHLDDAGVEINEGSCGHLGSLQTELTGTLDGESQTQVPGATLSSLFERPHALVVRRSAQSGAPILACGNLRS